MTITPLEPADALDDSELALAAARGDRLAFTAIYDRYADRLHDFCAGMLRDRDAAADCVQGVDDGQSNSRDAASSRATERSDRMS